MNVRKLLLQLHVMVDMACAQFEWIQHKMYLELAGHTDCWTLQKLGPCLILSSQTGLEKNRVNVCFDKNVDIPGIDPYSADYDRRSNYVSLIISQGHIVNGTVHSLGQCADAQEGEPNKRLCRIFFPEYYGRNLPQFACPRDAELLVNNYLPIMRTKYLIHCAAKGCFAEIKCFKEHFQKEAYHLRLMFLSDNPEKIRYTIMEHMKRYYFDDRFCTSAAAFGLRTVPIWDIKTTTTTTTTPTAEPANTTTSATQAPVNSQNKARVTCAEWRIVILFMLLSALLQQL